MRLCSIYGHHFSCTAKLWHESPPETSAVEHDGSKAHAVWGVKYLCVSGLVHLSLFLPHL